METTFPPSIPFFTYPLRESPHRSHGSIIRHNCCTQIWCNPRPPTWILETETLRTIMLSAVFFHLGSTGDLNYVTLLFLLLLQSFGFLPGRATYVSEPTGNDRAMVVDGNKHSFAGLPTNFEYVWMEIQLLAQWAHLKVLALAYCSVALRLS